MSNPVQPSTADLPSDPLLKFWAFIDANGQTDALAQGPDNSSSSAEPKVKRRLVAPETWLPSGWLVEDRVRSSGASAGKIDTYYVDPSSGRKFSSKKEVLYFLETGITPSKRKKGTETPASEEVSTGISAGNKQKKSDKKPKPLNFDFINVPKKVDWLLTNASADSWTPILGDDQVPESTRQDWATAFTSLTASKSDQAMF